MKNKYWLILLGLVLFIPSFIPLPVQASEKRVTIRSIGDILIHDSVYQDAWNGETYDFDKMFDAVRPYLQNADITTANLEVIAAGDSFEVSSYPTFNAPSEIIDALLNAGVDIVNNATNHTMDHGAFGAHESIKALQARNMQYVGSYDSWEDYNDLRIIDVNGIRVGFLAYTYGLNGHYLPEGEEYLATLIDAELMELEVKHLKKSADIAVVMIHNGEEYDHYPADYQISLNNLIRDAGANFILGGHPHIVQPVMYYSPTQGGIYSHGNFISGQVDLENKIGGIFEYSFVERNGQFELEKMRVMPTYSYGYPEFTEHGVVPLRDAGEWGVQEIDELFETLKTKLTYYTSHVEIVDYLD